MSDLEYEEYEESWTGRIAIAAVIVLALVAGAFFAGRAMAGGGPATLAEAVQQARAGDLPCGDTTQPGGGVPVGALCAQDGQQPPTSARGRFGGGQTGEVTAVSGDELTLTGPMGERTVKLDASTTVSTTATGKASDIETGDSVVVAGAGQGPATSITILPAGGN